MKKVSLSLIIMGILILSGFGAAGFLENNSEIDKRIEIITLSDKPLISEKDGYISLEFVGTNSFLDEAGKPMLPIYRKTFELSREAKINRITCEYSDINEKIIHGKIIPAPEAIPLIFPNSYKTKPKLVENKEVYQSDTFYPESWYDYKIKCGLNNLGEQTTFLIVDFHPIRYKPLDNKLIYVTDAKIQINYEDPGFDGFKTSADSYDMVIIAPEKFSEPLQPLVDHKNNFGIKTTIKTVEEIFSEYEGKDEPERIKYFLRDAKEDWGITYVLLVGGLKSYIFARDKDDRNHGSTNAWHVPVRYTNIKHSNEVGVLSDLYFSDLYRYNESLQEWEFEDWDSNGNGVFAEGSFMDKDELDLIPDIYAGRLACRNKIELNVIINKIIQYESTSPEDKPWFNRMIGVAGRTFSLFNGKDQDQYRDDDCENISDFEWQEFVPRTAKHARVEVKIKQEFIDSPDLKLSIEKPLGTVLTFKELPASEIPFESSGWVSFDVPDVYLATGEKYYITLTAPLGSEYGWCYSEPDILGRDRYPQGNSSRGSGYDWCFRTFGLSEGEEEPDGEYSVDAAFEYMGDLIEDPVRVYSSNKDTGGLIPETEDIIAAFSEGAGYVNFEGHGNPISWATHWADDEPGWTSGLSITDFRKLSNGDKLPVVIVGGCHNALFNVSILRILLTRKNHDNWYWTWYPTPVCFSWGLCILPNGGAIACTGCTGLGLGGTPPHLKNSGGLDSNFFYQIGNGSTTLGSAHSGAIRKYILENNVNLDEEFCIVEFHLFGDPSLKLGGYE